MGVNITFLHIKNNELQRHQTPAPAGEGWEDENKINWLYPLIPAFFLKGEGADTYVDTYPFS
jgi:hypothetical protein